MEIKERGIGIHKELNRSPISFNSAKMLDLFYNLIQRFNYNLTSSIEISKEELYKIANFEEQYRESEVNRILTELTKNTVFNIPHAKGRKIFGSVFTVREEEEGNITIWISEPFKPYIFHKAEIDLINKVKHNGTYTLELKEKEYWENELKEKKRFLLLLEQAELEGIKSKYGKRLYSLLVQYHLKNKFQMKISDFREIMEIPESYKLGQINADILKRVKEDLEKKGLFKFLDEPIGKKGKRRLTHIEINFEYLGKYKIKKSKEEFEKEQLESKKGKLLIKVSKLRKDFLFKKVEQITTEEELKEFAKENNLNID